MKISDCVARLQRVLTTHGDIQCASDCPYCGRSFTVGIVAIAPETARLNHREIDGPVGTRVEWGRTADSLNHREIDGPVGTRVEKAKPVEETEP